LKELSHPTGVLSARASNYLMVDKVEAPDPSTVVFRLKFATSAFLAALADRSTWSTESQAEPGPMVRENILGSG
jgi:peptide/nickel transport system substrate-binding protein